MTIGQTSINGWNSIWQIYRWCVPQIQNTKDSPKRLNRLTLNVMSVNIVGTLVFCSCRWNAPASTFSTQGFDYTIWKISPVPFFPTMAVILYIHAEPVCRYPFRYSIEKILERLSHEKNVFRRKVITTTFNISFVVQYV